MFSCDDWGHKMQANLMERHMGSQDGDERLI
jgi:hypothetical protein